MRAREAHEIDMPLGHGARGGGDVADPLGVDDGDVDRRLDGARHMQEGRDREGHVGHQDRERAPVAGLPGPDVEHVDQARARQAHGDLQAVLGVEPVGDELVGGHAHADDVVGPDLAAHLLQHLQAEAHAVLQAAAIGIGAPVDAGRPELGHQMQGLEGELDPVEPALAAAPRRLAEVADDPGEVPVLHLLGEGAVLGLPHRRGRHGRQPVAGVPARAPAHVRDLAHEGRAMGVHALGELAEMGDDPVLAHVELAEGARTVGGDDGGAAEHGHRHAALGLLGVVELIALPRHPALGIGRRMGGADDAVAQRQALDGERLQQGVVLTHLGGAPAAD